MRPRPISKDAARMKYLVDVISSAGSTEYLPD